LCLNALGGIDARNAGANDDNVIFLRRSNMAIRVPVHGGQLLGEFVRARAISDDVIGGCPATTRNRHKLLQKCRQKPRGRNGIKYQSTIS
jgi:hypothetical protein